MNIHIVSHTYLLQCDSLVTPGVKGGELSQCEFYLHLQIRVLLQYCERRYFRVYKFSRIYENGQYFARIRIRVLYIIG